MKNKEIPPVLVRTWYEQLSLRGKGQTEDFIAEQAQKKLLNQFGSFQNVADYLRKHNIIT